eukprot:363695-Pleurochrysis_carterae.AAC.2
MQLQHSSFVNDACRADICGSGASLAFRGIEMMRNDDVWRREIWQGVNARTNFCNARGLFKLLSIGMVMYETR